MIVDLPTLESFLVTMVVAAIRTVLEASPTILGGVAISAWLRTLATPVKIQSIFFGEGIQGSLRTILVGMAMPVCAIGILPVLRELRSLGLPTNKLIILGVSAPLLNPFSILFGLTVLSFPLYLIMVVATMVLAIIVGEVSDRFAMRTEITALPRPAGLTGGTRMRNLLIASGRLVTGRTLFDLAVTIVVSGLTVSLVHAGAFYILCESTNQAGTGVASILSLTQYVSPSRAIIQLGGIEDANLSTATGLGIYLCGSAISGASLLALLQWQGLRRTFAISIAFLLFVGLSTYLSRYLIPNPVVEIAETNALDNLSRPIHGTFQQIDKDLTASLSFLNTFMYFGSAALLLLVLTGIIARIAKVNLRDDDPNLIASQSDGRLSMALSASQLGAVSIAIVGILFFISTFLFFPGPNEVMQEMDMYQMDARLMVQTGNINAAVDRLDAWDSAAAGVPIGAAIRGSFPTKLQRELTRELRTELRDFRQLLTDGDVVAAEKRLPDLKRRLTEIKTVFQPGGK